MKRGQQLSPTMLVIIILSIIIGVALIFFVMKLRGNVVP
jgi:hypothetical protein